MDETVKQILLKRKIKELSSYKGQGTQLISLYLPPDVDRSSVNKQLTDELSQSSNIKSSQTRKNVQSALKRLINYLKQIDFNLPNNGLILFSGDISTNPSKSDVTLIDIEPPKKLTTKLYWCDSSFHVTPLEEMAETDQIYGIIAVDKREVTIAIIRGKLKEIVGHETSGVPGKARAGGQCLKEAIIQLSDGNLIDIANLKKASLISTNLKNFTFKSSKIKDKWEVSKTKTYKITTKFPSLEIKCSQDHIFYVNSEFGVIEKTADKLKKGNLLLMPETIKISGKLQFLDSKKHSKSFKTNNKDIKLPTQLNKDFAQFLGYFLGSGFIEENTFSFFEKQKQVCLDYQLLFKNLFKLKPIYNFNALKKTHQLRFTSSSLFKLIKKEFMEFLEPLDSQVSKKILLSPNNVVAGFLKGFFDSRALINLNKKSLFFQSDNKLLVQQIQLLLLRFSIISSLEEVVKNNSKKPINKNKKYILTINEKESIDLFKQNISFTSKESLKNLNKIKSNEKNSRLLLFSGKQIKKILEKEGLDLNNYPKLKSFFKSNQMISKAQFKKSILNLIKNKVLFKKLKEILDYQVLPLEINKIQIIKEKSKMIDISVVNKNFIANGLIVHNSAHRFERLREKAAEDFYKRVGDKTNAAFVPIEGLKGIIVGGPGTTKHEFIEHANLDHRIKDKIIGTVDVSYTDESGIKEILDKSTDILNEVGIVKEKKLLDKFVSEVAKNNLGIYGFKEVQEALNFGQVSTVLISEGLEWFVLKFKCLKTDKIFFKIAKTKDEINTLITSIQQTSKECEDQSAELLEEADLFDYFVELAQNTSSNVTMVSIDTTEGKSFLDTFGGIGAFLKI